jgi:uncharacterized membrane protein YwaF
MTALFPLWPLDLIGLVLLPALFFAFRNRPARTQYLVLHLLCLANFLGWLVNDLYGLARGQDIRTMFPLQLCNIAVFLLPLSLLLRRRTLWDLLFYVCALGALAALLFPSADYIGHTWAGITLGFFVNHLMILGIPLLLAGWGLYRPEPTPRRLAALSLLVLGLASALHLLNVLMNRAWGVEADYFFTIIRFSAPQNPVFALFARLVPLDLLYLLPALPILWLSAPLMALPWNWRRWLGRGR